MVLLGEKFKPSLQYRPYLAIMTIASVILIWLFSAGFTIATFPSIIFFSAMILLVVAIGLGLLWSVLYYESVVYLLNKTEMTWKRGVWFRTTGIVPYNRITNIDIVQGPIMRLFHISNLKIQTAGSSANTTASEITLIGITDPEPLRALIMDFVRGQPPVAAVTGAETAGIPSNTNSDMAALLAEVSKIRKILESKR